MASLLRLHSCPACAHAHNFVLHEGPVGRGEEFVYVCPETGYRASLKADEPGSPVGFAPQGSVSLTPTRVRRAA